MQEDLPWRGGREETGPVNLQESGTTVIVAGKAHSGDHLAETERGRVIRENGTTGLEVMIMKPKEERNEIMIGIEGEV